MNKKLSIMFFLMAILMLATPVFAQGEPCRGCCWHQLGCHHFRLLAGDCRRSWPHLDRARSLLPPAKVWPAILQPALVFRLP